MPTLPLIASHGHATAGPLAYRGGRAIAASTFLRDACALAGRLPAGGPLLNLCEDRYHFTVALAAGLISQRGTLLPPAHAPEVLRKVHTLSPTLICITDQPRAPGVLIELRCPVLTVSCAADSLAPARAIPQIDAAQTAMTIFTSGSTGMPVPHIKRFGQMAEAARVQLTQLPATAAEPGYALLGTVPAQHMFGLEATVLLSLQSGSALCAERPFYPADIAVALACLPRPRALVSTPVHLRALLDAAIDLPALDLVLCATAALPPTLARDIEARCGSALIEIYGSTETGMMASRRTAHERRWRLFPGIRLHRAQDGWSAQGGHLPMAMPLADELEVLDDEHFLLHGRTADLVNVAGKRSSLAHLSQQLLSIRGVDDGAFFVHDGSDGGSITGVTRVAAVAVTSSLSHGEILAALRERVDAVFLPRPLWLVDQLPRNATGKLTRDALRTLAAKLSADHGRARS